MEEERRGLGGFGRFDRWLLSWYYRLLTLPLSIIRFVDGVVGFRYVNVDEFKARSLGEPGIFICCGDLHLAVLQTGVAGCHLTGVHCQCSVSRWRLVELLIHKVAKSYLTDLN